MLYFDGTGMMSYSIDRINDFINKTEEELNEYKNILKLMEFLDEYCDEERHISVSYNSLKDKFNFSKEELKQIIKLLKDNNFLSVEKIELDIYYLRIYTQREIEIHEVDDFFISSFNYKVTDPKYVYLLVNDNNEYKIGMTKKADFKSKDGKIIVKSNLLDRPMFFKDLLKNRYLRYQIDFSDWFKFPNEELLNELIDSIRSYKGQYKEKRKRKTMND